MLSAHWLWIVFTLFASVAQTLRNVFQRELIASVGAANAAFVRFLYGAPFGLAFFPIALLIADAPPPTPDARAWFYLLLASAAQTFGTVLMLLAMKGRSFVVVTALMKTEPAMLAIFGAALFGEALDSAGALGVALASVGVLLASLPRGAGPGALRDARAAAFGLGSAAVFALASASYRAGALALGGPPFLAAAAELAYALTLQSAFIVAYLALFDRAGLAALLREWRPSLLAGFVGAFATLLWFLAFALETAARVRALGLVEIFFAYAAARRFLAQGADARELAGLALILVGVALVLLRAS